jgi:hypothetical protein
LVKQIKKQTEFCRVATMSYGPEDFVFMRGNSFDYTEVEMDCYQIIHTYCTEISSVTCGVFDTDLFLSDRLPEFISGNNVNLVQFFLDPTHGYAYQTSWVLNALMDKGFKFNLRQLYRSFANPIDGWTDFVPIEK